MVWDAGLILLRHNTAEQRRLVAYFLSAANNRETRTAKNPEIASAGKRVKALPSLPGVFSRDDISGTGNTGRVTQLLRASRTV